jgi:hypothetical protein
MNNTQREQSNIIKRQHKGAEEEEGICCLSVNMRECSFFFLLEGDDDDNVRKKI